MKGTDRTEVTPDSHPISLRICMKAKPLADCQRVDVTLAVSQEGRSSRQGQNGKQNWVVHADTEQHSAAGPAGGSSVAVERSWSQGLAKNALASPTKVLSNELCLPTATKRAVGTELPKPASSSGFSRGSCRNSSNLSGSRGPTAPLCPGSGRHWELDPTQRLPG